MKPEFKRHIETVKAQKEAARLTKELVSFTNVMGSDIQRAIADGIAEGLMTEHRTLQQSFVCAFHNAMIKYSESRTDMRNQAAVDYAKKVAKLEAYFPFI